MLLKESVNTKGEKVYLFNGNTFTSKDVFWLQVVRLADVFLIGPFLIYISTIKTLPVHLRVLLFVIGLGTIFYNGLNYLREIK